MNNKPRKVMDDEDFQDLLEEDEDEEEQELEEGSNEQQPQYPQRLPTQNQKQANSPGYSNEAEEIQHAVQPQKTYSGRGRPPKGVQVRRPQMPVAAQKRFTAFAEPERAGIMYADTQEVYAEGIPLWAAQIYADLKNDLEEIKDIIGRL